MSDAVTIGMYNIAPFIVKIILSWLAFASSLPPEKKQYFFYLSFSSTLQLINGISCDLQKLFKCFTGTGIVAFSRVLLTALGAG